MYPAERTQTSDISGPNEQARCWHLYRPVKLGPVQYDRTVEPCHRQVHGAGCADKPLPFDEYLHKRNREADTVELSSIEPPSIRVSNPKEPEHAPTKIKPEAIHEEVTREVTVRYEIPSELMTGRLIDLLL